MSWANELRTAIESGIGNYQAAAGIGPDAYCQTPMVHPMADGKYLHLLAVLHGSRLLSTAQFEARVSDAGLRLSDAAAATSTAGKGWRWGLGFGWRDLPASEPFLITCAVVVRGALQCRHEGATSPSLAVLLDQGVRGLDEWLGEFSLPVDGGQRTLPAYSPGIRAPIYNAAAYGYAALNTAARAGYPTRLTAEDQESMEWIVSRRIPGLGWPYSPASGIVDLLHQCYLLNSMADYFGTATVEPAAAEMIGQFAGLGGFVDVIHLLAAAGDGEPRPGREIPWLRQLAGERIEVLPKPARLWSLGELLVLVSRLAGEGERREGWLRLGRRLAESILDRLRSADDAEALYPRHAMHAQHGLAAYLSLLRQQARESTAVVAATSET